MRVEKNGKADNLQLEPGDIIMRVNNSEVNTPEELFAALKGKKQLRILVRRGNTIGTITVNNQSRSFLAQLALRFTP